MMDCHIWALTFQSVFLFLLVLLQSLVLMIEEIFAWNLSLKVHLPKCSVAIVIGLIQSSRKPRTTGSHLRR